MHTFGIELVRQLSHAAGRPEVCGFKSVVCYRSGLDVSPTGNEPALDQAIVRIYKEFLKAWPVKELRLDDKPLNDLVVQVTLTIAANFNKPGMLLFHQHPGFFALTQAFQCNSTRASVTTISPLRVPLRHTSNHSSKLTRTPLSFCYTPLILTHATLVI